MDGLDPQAVDEALHHPHCRSSYLGRSYWRPEVTTSRRLTY